MVSPGRGILWVVGNQLLGNNFAIGRKIMNSRTIVCENVATCLVDLGRTSVADRITVVTPGNSPDLGRYFEAQIFANSYSTPYKQPSCGAIILARLICAASCYFQRQLELMSCLNGDIDTLSQHHNLCQSQQVDNIRQLDGKSHHMCFGPAKLR